MMNRRFVSLASFLLSAACAFAADVAGKWTASFETQIGTQNYTYEFKVDGQKLTGTAKSNFGEGKIQDGKVSGDEHFRAAKPCAAATAVASLGDRR